MRRALLSLLTIVLGALVILAVTEPPSDWVPGSDPHLFVFEVR